MKIKIAMVLSLITGLLSGNVLAMKEATKEVKKDPKVSVCLLPGNQFFLYSKDDGSIKLYNINEDQPVKTFSVKSLLPLKTKDTEIKSYKKHPERLQKKLKDEKKKK